MLTQNKVLTDLSDIPIRPGTILMDAQGVPTLCERVDSERGPHWSGNGYPPNPHGYGGPWTVLHIPLTQEETNEYALGWKWEKDA